jgi:hypothetical protein
MYSQTAELQFELRGSQGDGTKVPFFLGVTVDGYQSLVEAAAFILKMKKLYPEVEAECFSENSYLFTMLRSVLSQNGIFNLNNVSLQDLPRCYDTQQYQKKATGQGVARMADTLNYKLETRGLFPDCVFRIFH